MNIYMTSGTFDFLKRIKEKYRNESMLLMQNQEGAVLVHETANKTVFSAPRSYEVLKSEGILENFGFLVLHHIPVIEDDKPVFEYQFKSDSAQQFNTTGFAALRVLRPMKNNTYVILTLWNSEGAYIAWENSPHYQSFLQGAKSAPSQPQLFLGASYTSKFYIPTEDD